MSANEQKTWVRTSTIAKKIEVRTDQMQKWIKAGTIPRVLVRRIGKLYFLHRENFMRWFEEGKMPAEARRRGGNRRA